MKTRFSTAGIQWSMNILIVLFIITAVLTIAPRLQKIFFRPQEIKLIRTEIPWVHPTSDVTIMLYSHMLENNPALHSKVSRNIMIYDTLKRFILVTLFILILVQLKNLIIAIKKRAFFVENNLKIIRNLSILTFIWIAGNFIIYELIPVFIPMNLMYERINFIAFHESLLENIISALDIKIILVAFILYIISVSFKEGYKLKEESDLTI